MGRKPLGIKVLQWGYLQFFDIDGAFGNVLPEAVIRALVRFGVGTNFKFLIFDLLCYKLVMPD